MEMLFQVIMDGDRVKWPNGLALDYVDKRVYWADAKIKSIFSCDYWGKDVKVGHFYFNKSNLPLCI